MQLSVDDAAAWLNVSPETVYQWIRHAAIPFHQVNEQIRFNRSELLEWATARNLPVAPGLFEGTVSGGPPAPSLIDALRRGGIVERVDGADSAAVLRQVVDRLPLPSAADRDPLYDVLLARERLGSTGIGDGIAIPHVRNPVVLLVEEPLIQLAFLATPIDFGAVDGLPVDTLFTLVCPTIHIHLRLLARLGFVLREPEIRDALKQRMPRGTLLARLAAAEAAIPASVGN